MSKWFGRESFISLYQSIVEYGPVSNHGHEFPVVSDNGGNHFLVFFKSQHCSHTQSIAYTVKNLATMLGDRYRGASGAAVALLGLLGFPLAILVVAASFYDRFADNADVKAGLAGAAAGAAGLVGGTALRILKGANPDVLNFAIAGGVCVGAFLKLPILVLLGGAIPLSISFGIWRRRSTP